MGYRYDGMSDEMEMLAEAEVSNDNGASWVKIIILKLPPAGAGLYSFSFLVPTLGAEGSLFSTPEMAVAAGLRLILGFILVLLAIII